MEVVVDKRTEFMGIILMLSKYNIVYENQKNNESNRQYIENINNWFQKYKDDNFIEIVNSIIDKFHYFNYSNPFDLILRCFDEDFNFLENIEETEYSDILATNLGRQFLIDLPKFAKITDFNKFYESQQKFYNKCISFQTEYLKNKKLEKYYMEYYGVEELPRIKCNMLLVDSVTGGYGLEINRTLFPTLSVQFDGANQYPCSVTMLFHEMSHPIINPLTEKYFVYNGDKITKMKHYNGAQSMKSIINEYVIRASEILLLEHYNDTNAVNNRITLENNRGFTRIKEVVECLKLYINNRFKYETLEDYYPILLNEIINQVLIENNCR